MWGRVLSSDGEQSRKPDGLAKKVLKNRLVSVCFLMVVGKEESFIATRGVGKFILATTGVGIMG